MQGKVHVSDPQAVEPALNQQRQASLARAGPGLPPVRATVLNLVAYAGEPARADEMAHQAATLAEHHPLRAILLGTRPRQRAEEWDIWVWAYCYPALPAQVICFEAVQIMADERSLDRVPAVALSLLRRDLPVMLWWPGDLPMGTALFEHLMANSDRLVVDSASATDPGRLLRCLATRGRAGRGQCIIGDLNWSRLTPWRELTAQFFDPPDCRPCLEWLEHVRLEFACPAGWAESAQACLFAAWLATRLAWVPAATLWGETTGGAQLNLRRGRQPVVVEFVPLPLEANEQGLHMVALRTGHPEGQATFTIQRFPVEARAVVSTALPNREVRQRVVPFPAPSPTSLLGGELERPGCDLVYQEALRLAAFFSAQRGAGA